MPPPSWPPRSGSGRLFLQDVERHAARTLAEQDFNQVGQTAARPWPWQLGQAGFVDVHRQDAAFVLVHRLPLDKMVAQPLIAQMQRYGRGPPLRQDTQQQGCNGNKSA